MRRWAALLTGIVAGCLGAVPIGAAAAPIVLPSLHPIATDKTIALELVPPQEAKVCSARIGRGERPGRRFPIELGGPSRRLSWHIAVSGHGQWTLSISCGTSKSRPDSLGTTSREFQLGHGRGRPRLRVMPGSFRSTRGFLPVHAPRPDIAARFSISSEINTPAARPCANPYMSNAYVVGSSYATRIGFTPTTDRVEDIDRLWRDLEACVPFPSMTSDARDSLIKQMACYEFYGPTPGRGVTFDMEAWHENPSWPVAMKSATNCQHWPNVPLDLANSYFQGYIVQGSLDTSTQKAAYLIELSPSHFWFKDHILTSKAFYCTKASHPGPVVLPSDYLNEMIPNKGADIGDSACDAAPPSYGPPPGSLAGTLYLTQGPAAPSGYWYAVSLVGYPASTGVPITCRDSVSPGGFITFTLHTDTEGNATSTSGCYSGDGPDHWVTAYGNESNHVSWGGSSGPPPPPPQTWSEQETPNHPVNTFTNYHNASGMGPAIAAGQWVQVSCKVYDPTIVSVNPDGYWYRIASSPWNNAYYSPANTFMNGDPYGGPYTHNTDFAVPNC
jgi:hypothetical protein